MINFFPQEEFEKWKREKNSMRKNKREIKDTKTLTRVTKGDIEKKNKEWLENKKKKSFDRRRRKSE